MSVTVKIFTKASGQPSLCATRELDALPVSIGRAASCNVTLEDPQKHISRFVERDFMGAYQAQLRRLKGGRRPVLARYCI